MNIDKNIVAHLSRQKSVFINIVLIFVFSLPCALGFNVFSGVNPFGAGTYIQDLEDFFVTYNFLPLGSLAYLLFCTSRYGWGFENFLVEANEGKGIRLDVYKRQASASCFPVFPTHNFQNQSFIDGGYYDNVPVDLALDMGADEVIVVDMHEEADVYKRQS